MLSKFTFLNLKLSIKYIIMTYFLKLVILIKYNIDLLSVNYNFEEFMIKN